MRVVAGVSKEESLRQAAEYCVDTYVKDGAVVGVGTGQLAGLILETIAARLERGALSGVRCVPASDVAASEAAFHGVPQATLEQCPQVDVAFEEGDEVDCSHGGLPFILGRASERAQPQLPRARAVAAAASGAVVLLLDDMARIKGRLGAELPVVVEAEGWEDSAEALDDVFLGDAEIWRRPSVPSPSIGPRGGDSPYVSSEGHALVDVRFYGALKLNGREDAAYEDIAAEIEGVPGVVTHGLALGLARVAVVAGPEGDPFVLELGEKIVAGSAAESSVDE